MERELAPGGAFGAARGEEGLARGLRGGGARGERGVDRGRFGAQRGEAPLHGGQAGAESLEAAVDVVAQLLRGRRDAAGGARRLRGEAASGGHLRQLAQRFVHRAGGFEAHLVRGAQRAVRRIFLADRRAQLPQVARERFAAAPAVELAQDAREHGAEIALGGGGNEIVGDPGGVVVPVAVEVLHLAQQAQRVRIMLQLEAGRLHEKENQRSQ